MEFCRTTFHVVQQGDTFYRLAQKYQTTVPDIIMRNPGINPYNLQVGTRLRICAGHENGNFQQEEMALNNDMRQAWSKHNMWANMLMASQLNDLPNRENMEVRMMQTPEEIAAVFSQFYSQPMVNQLKQMLTEHVQIGNELIMAMKDNDTARAEQLEAQWNQNADKIARMLSSANEKYDYDDLREMLRMHLRLMKDTVMADLNSNYNEAIRLMDENDNHTMMMADALTNGLLEQFYQR